WGEGRTFFVGGDLIVQPTVYDDVLTAFPYPVEGRPSGWIYTPWLFEYLHIEDAGQRERASWGYQETYPDSGEWVEFQYGDGEWGYTRAWDPACAELAWTRVGGGYVSADGMGFGVNGGPLGIPISGQGGGSYGGAGGAWSDFPYQTACYGDIAQPAALGSGGRQSAAGGAIKFVVAGSAVVDGIISANGVFTRSVGSGSGGSVWIQAADISGSGEITANSLKSGTWPEPRDKGNRVICDGPGYGSGGGGRIAIELTGSDDFTMIDFVEGAVSPTLTVRAQGHIGAYGGDSTASHNGGGAGSIYLKGMSQAAHGDCYYHAVDSLTGSYITENVVAEVGNLYIIGIPSGNTRTTWLVVREGGKLDVYGSIILKDSGRLYAEGGTVELLGNAPATLSNDRGGTGNAAGAMDFYNLVCTVPGKQIRVDGTLNVANDITILGDDSDLPASLIDLGPVVANTPWYLNIAKPLPMYNIHYALIAWGNAAGSVQGVTVADCEDGSGNVNIIFARPADTVTWTGAEDSDWNNENNWHPGLPSSLDDVVIAPTLSGNYPELNAVFMFHSLTIAAGATMTVNANLTVSTDFTLAGTLVTTGASAIYRFAGGIDVTGGVFDPMPGTVILGGLGDQAITSDGTVFDKFVVENAAGIITMTDDFAAATFTTVEAVELVFDGDVAVENLSFGNASTVTALGDVNAVQLATGEGSSLAIGGDLACAGMIDNTGSLAVTGSVTAGRLVNTEAAFVAGSVTATFFEHYRSGSVTIDAGNSLVADYVILKGKAGADPVVVRSSSLGTAFNLVATVKAVCAVNLDIDDCDASGGFIAALCAIGGNVTGFDTSVAWKYWIGLMSQHIDRIENWVPQGVPTPDEGVIIDYDYGTGPYYFEQAYETYPVHAKHLIIGGNKTTSADFYVRLRYPDAIRVTGDCAILTNGIVTSIAEFAVDMVVEGDLFVGGRIDVIGKGYPARTGPGAGGRVAMLPGGNPEQSIGGGTHGGIGGRYVTLEYGPTYGSITQPTTLGSGGSQAAGGGVIRIVCDNTIHCFGVITAMGNGQKEIGVNNYTGSGSGGSVWVTTGHLVGTGSINADGGKSRQELPPSYYENGFSHGGGGRVAIELTHSESLGDVAITANGWAGTDSGGHFGSGPGSVFLRSPLNPLGTCTYDKSASYVNAPGLRITELVEDTTVGNFVIIGDGAMDFLMTNASVTVLGDWRRQGDGATTFITGEEGAVEFAGTGTQGVYGNTRFSNLVATNAATTLAFESESETQVGSSLVLHRVSIVSTEPGVAAYLTLLEEAEQDILRVRVKDSDASLGETLYALPPSFDLGGNDN
ncbi:MAG: hypothetical protein FWF84_05515, partial [Kiritimatiellaeota bacterium]|nr:hypothetical protein [Kiritimatiellota bacterium]